jgi:hypothetical protein
MLRRGRIEYATLVEDALRGVVREVLSRLARGEIGAPHHYYITFRTTFPGVVLPDHLLARYPHEITIVLQYQFWDLEVGEDAFSVTLSFSDVLHRLTVPFRAIRIFADPSVEFGLQFTVPDETVAPVRLPIATAREGESAEAAPKEQTRAADETTPADDGGKVVTLDRFRRK